MSGLSLVPYFSVHRWLPRYSHLTRVGIRYSVCVLQVLQGTSKRSKFSWILYWHIWSVQELLHKYRVAPLLARCCFTVLSNHKSQGLRGVTTVCLIYRSSPIQFENHLLDWTLLILLAHRFIKCSSSESKEGPQAKKMVNAATAEPENKMEEAKSEWWHSHDLWPNLLHEWHLGALHLSTWSTISPFLIFSLQ